MGSICRALALLSGTILALLATASLAAAQTVEISPFYGYRVGGSISQVPAGPVVDDDGGPSFGAVVDIVFGSLTDGLKVEGVYSHEETNLEVETSPFDPRVTVRAEVD